MSSDSSSAYRNAGVDIDAGNALLKRIRPLLRETRRPEVLGDAGGFASLCKVPAHFREPVLAAGADGVGTKLKLALEAGRLGGIGADLVAMCVNDVLTVGAEPLFFLDYYATGRLEVETAAEVVAGIAAACREAGCALSGGETAEMPGLYAGKDFDLAGFCVGVVERDRLLGADRVQEGDVLLALPSSGPHANGYSLIRSLLAEHPQEKEQVMTGGGTVLDALLAPTRIYAKVMQSLPGKVQLHAAAHITGGGLLENLPRIMPSGLRPALQAEIGRQEIFSILQRLGKISEREMYRTFNCGIGMVLCLAAQDTKQCLAQLHDIGEQAWHCGEVESGSGVRINGQVL